MSGPVMGGSTSINESLYRIFNGDKIICIDNRDMSFTYLLYDSSLIGFIVELYSRDLLPRPVGINIESVRLESITSWGFGSYRKRFNQGNFYKGNIIGG